MNILENMNRRVSATKRWLPYVEPVKGKIAKVESMDLARAQIHSVLFVGTTKERLETIRMINSGWWGVNRARKIVETSDSGEKALERLTKHSVIMEIEKEDDDPILAQ